MAEPRAWIALHPKGRLILLVPQPDLKGWWRQAGSFPSLKDALKYAADNGIEIEQKPKVNWIRAKHVPMRIRRITPRLFLVLKYIQSRREQLSKGSMSAYEMGTELGVSPAGLLYNIGVLADLGYVRIIYRNQGQHLRLDITSEGVEQLAQYQEQNSAGPSPNAEQSA